MEQPQLARCVTGLNGQMAPLAEGDQVRAVAMSLVHVEMVDGQNVAGFHTMGVAAMLAAPASFRFDLFRDFGPVWGVIVQMLVSSIARIDAMLARYRTYNPAI